MNMMGVGVRQLAGRPSVEMPGVEALTLSGVTADIMRAGGGRPLVFLHAGAGPDWLSWEYLSRLSEHFVVVTPFHHGLGFGLSAGKIAPISLTAIHRASMIFLGEVFLGRWCRLGDSNT